MTKIGPAKNEGTASIILVSTPFRAAMLIALLISGSGFIWSCFAKVPIYVNGFGLFVEGGNHFDLNSASQGELNFNFNLKGVKILEADQKLFELAYQNTFMESKELENITIYALRTQERLAPEKAGEHRRIKARKGNILAWINNPKNYSELQNKLDKYRNNREVLSATKNKTSLTKQKLLKNIFYLKKQIQFRLKFLNEIENLFSEGAANQSLLLDQNEKISHLMTKVASQEEKIIAIDNELIEANINHESSISGLKKELKDFISKTFVFAENNIFVEEILASHLSQVSNNDSILKVSKKKIDAPLIHVPAFLSQDSGQQVRRGMKLLATPSGMSRTQYGGMVGEVTTIQNLPLSINEIKNVLGSEAAAENIYNLVPDPLHMTFQLQAQMDEPDSAKQGIRWSTSGKIPYEVRRGELLNIQITTNTVTPISLLIPWLRRTAPENMTSKISSLSKAQEEK